jgi:hypothetical protein
VCIICGAGFASRRCLQVSSNYKGFPVCQASGFLGDARSASPSVYQTSSFSSSRDALRVVDGLQKGCGLEKLQPVINCSQFGLQTLMKDARGGSIR